VRWGGQGGYNKGSHVCSPREWEGEMSSEVSMNHAKIDPCPAQSSRKSKLGSQNYSRDVYEVLQCCQVGGGNTVLWCGRVLARLRLNKVISPNNQ